MKKGIKKIYIIEIIMIAITVVLFFLKNTDNKYLLSIITLGIILFTLRQIYKKRKDTNIFRKQAFTIVFAVLLFYFIILFLLGLLLGYNITYFSLNPINWLHGLIPILIITIIVEKIRLIVIKNNEENRLSIYLLTAILILFYIVISTNSIIINSWYKAFIYICTIFMPIIAQEMLSTHVTSNYGYLPTIEYKLVMKLYLYIIPIFTNLGDYLHSAIGIIIPFTLYVVLSRFLKTDEDIRQRNLKIKKFNFSFITAPVIIVLVVIISLVSGLFKHQMIAIASDSMVPTYARGDAIIFEKYEDQEIKEGEIIVFKKRNILIAHRVIKTTGNSEKQYFYTKGDANKSPDNEYVSQEEVLGIVKRVAKYIGYPTVWINELFRRWDRILWEWTK